MYMTNAVYVIIEGATSFVNYSLTRVLFLSLPVFLLVSLLMASVPVRVRVATATEQWPHLVSEIQL